MRIGVLTSSRADYSIYYPLLNELKNDKFFDLQIICFGAHLSSKHGYTLENIIQDGFDVSFQIETIVEGDTPFDISMSIGQTVIKFSKFWDKEKFDIVFCLGDRYEMFAACVAGISFNIKFAHLHGGEQTLGAIDEIFRHSITHISSLHFTSSEQYAERVVELKHCSENIHNVGALSIDNLKRLKLFTKDEVKERFDIDISIPSILITFHPETVSYEKNEKYVDILISALREIKDYQLIITMPNADTNGEMIRAKLNSFIKSSLVTKGVESFGTVGYLSCMKYCSFLLGNTSSGFIEASFFPKYVINIGSRQQGRIVTDNIRNIEINKKEILDAVFDFKQFTFSGNEGKYGDGNAAKKISDILKKNIND